MRRMLSGVLSGGKKQKIATKPLHDNRAGPYSIRAHRGFKYLIQSVEAETTCCNLLVFT